MISAILLIPLFLIRYGLLSVLDKGALPRAAFFTPMHGLEKTMFWIYQLSTLAIMVNMFFLRIKTEAFLFGIGFAMYVVGVLLFTMSVVSFAKPAINGINQAGLYRFSRNPMYVAYFIYFLSCSLMTQSTILFVFVCIFQISAHWIILSEERWCINQFGEEYKRYMKKVGRYV